MRREDKIAQARALRSEGLLLKEIAERMGCAVSTVHQYLSDPDLSKLRARKDSYRGECIDCGAPTDGSNGPDRAPERCMGCIQWTREGVLLAFHEWGDENGGVPPRVADAHNNDALPYESTVRKLFGSWNEALLAAGFELRCDRRSETWQDMLASVRAGESVASIASRYGVSESAIHQRFQVRGMRVDAERPLGYVEARNRANGLRLAAHMWGVAA